MSPEAIGRTIQLILAPVVMFSACSVFVGGVLNHYTSVGDRIRALTRERLELLRAGKSTLGLERLDEIDTQLPELLHKRHRDESECNRRETAENDAARTDAIDQPAAHWSEQAQ